MVAESYTVDEARGFMYQTFYQAWTNSSTGWPSILPDAYAVGPNGSLWPNVIWDAEEPADDTPIVAPELYIAVRHLSGDQASLRGADGVRWERKGFILVRMRFPPKMPLNIADALSKVVSDAFQAKRGVGAGYGIWFRKARMVEAGSKDGRYRHDVIANFEYDEIS